MSRVTIIVAMLFSAVMIVVSPGSVASQDATIKIKTEKAKNVSIPRLKVTTSTGSETDRSNMKTGLIDSTGDPAKFKSAPTQK